MIKCLKPYFGKLKKQQCIRRGASCWAQRVDTQVDWPNSFWDMRKCLKPYFCKLKKQQCTRRSATCWAQRVDTQVDWPNSFRDMTKCLKPYFCKLKNNSSFGAVLPAEHNASTLRSMVQQFLRYDKMFKTLFLQIEETTVYSARRYLLSTTRWHSGQLAQ